MLNVHADTLSFTLPSSLAEVTFGQAIALRTTTDIAAIVSLLSNKHISDFRPLKAPDLYALCSKHLTFLSELPSAYTLPVAEVLTVAGKTVRVPRSLGAECSIGQWQDVEKELSDLNLPEEGVTIEELAPTLLSIFLAPLVTGSPYTDIEQASGILPALMAIPCTDALPVAAFFLSSYSSPTPSGRVFLRPVPPKPTRMQRWRRSLRRALIPLRTTLRFVR